MMRKIIWGLLIFSLSTSVQAHDAQKGGKSAHSHSHREHGAHQHGVGQAGLAFEGAVGKFEMKIPAESIIGFEHEAKSEKDIKKRDEALAHFESKFSEMLSFDKSLNCKLTKEKVEIQHENSSEGSATAKKSKKAAAHSDFVAQYAVACEKSPLGTQLAINFHSQFKKLKKIEFQFVIDSFQKSITVMKADTKFDFK